MNSDTVDKPCEAERQELEPPKSKGQYTTTIEKQFYRLGTDTAAAEKQFRFFLNKHEMDEAVDDNPCFCVIVDKWLIYVEKNRDPERHRLCHYRLV